VDDLGVLLGDGVAGQGGAVQLVRTARLQRHQRLAQGIGEGLVGMGQHAEPAAIGAESAQHAIDTVQRRARHQADEERVGAAIAHSTRASFPTGRTMDSTSWACICFDCASKRARVAPVSSDDSEARATCVGSTWAPLTLNSK
jgi:hypothetical protein